MSTEETAPAPRSIQIVRAIVGVSLFLAMTPPLLAPLGLALLASG